MQTATVRALAHFVPERLLDNAELASRFPEWPEEKIYKKLGIHERHVVREDETALDLAERACDRLLEVHNISPYSIDALVFCTQSPDYALPPNSCLLHQRLGLNAGIPTFDYAHGCSGYVYGLFITKSLIESGMANTVLLVNAETYSRYISIADKNAATIFGDAATATLLVGEERTLPSIGRFVFHTDGSGAGNLIVPHSGQRATSLDSTVAEACLRDGSRRLTHLYMNGRAIFEYAMTEVPHLLEKMWERYDTTEIDFFIFHQANGYLLDSLYAECAVPEEKRIRCLSGYGNTVSCSIPLALEDALARGAVSRGNNLLLAGFGVGYSAAACTLTL